MPNNSLEEVYTDYYRQGVTDGLPIIPPTDKRVKKMLQGTNLNPNEELTTYGERGDILTVERLAVNAVIAGCLPIHMPVLVAGARALGNPAANAIQASVSTGSWAYLYLLNGPIREVLDVNADTGAFGPGFRSNRTVGRALGLAYKNTARIHPGEKDMGTLGNPFKFSLVAAENEKRSPWKPFHVEHGYDAGESTITVATPQSFVQHMPPDTSTQGVLKGIVHNIPPRITAMRTQTLTKEACYAICPFNAEELDEFSKHELKEYIAENATKPEEYGTGGVEPDRDLSVNPLREPQFDDPNLINVFVTGGSGRFNAIMGPTLGEVTTKRIAFPDNWDALLEEYGPKLERDWGR